MLHNRAIEEAQRIYRRAGLDIATLPEICVRPVRCGRFLHKRNRIVLPEWLGEHVDDPATPRYVEWYVAHELAHGIAGETAKHGPVFQLILAALAPEAWHWESTYKPREYARAFAAVTGVRL